MDKTATVNANYVMVDDIRKYEKLNTLEDIRIEIIKGNTDLMHKVINNYNK